MTRCVKLSRHVSSMTACQKSGRRQCARLLIENVVGVLHETMYADQDEDDAAENLGLAAQELSEAPPDYNTQKEEKKREKE